MRRCSVWLSCSLLALAVAAAPLVAQQLPSLRLSPANATHPHEFTSVTSLRELADGRVLVTDSREQRLLLLDFGSGASRAVGRAGRGPREYSMVAAVHPLAGDSSIMADYFQRRWLLFHSDSIVGTTPPDHPAVQAIQAIFTHADQRVVARRVDPPLQDGVTFQTARDSGALVLVDRTSGRADTIAKLRLTPSRRTQQTNAEGRVIASSTFPTQRPSSEESFALLPDGAVAIARLDPFRVDWRLPNGRWVRGDSLPVPKLRFDARERRAFEARIAGPQAALPPGFPTPPAADFPEFVPPFPVGLQAVIAGPRGLLLIQRNKSADNPGMTYLVIDRSSRIVGTFTLSNREQVVGASDNALYITERDEDDILRLRRHPWR